MLGGARASAEDDFADLIQPQQGYSVPQIDPITGMPSSADAPF